jgi:hypothetical protein
MDRRDGGSMVLKELRPLFPVITKIVADGGNQGPQMAAVVAAMRRNGRSKSSNGRC